MAKIHSLLAILLVVSSIQAMAQHPQKDKYLHPDLEQAWESSQTLETPESVIYDSENMHLFVANINGRPLDKDGNGYISKMDLQGKILEKKWVTGLNAPKGMAIKGNKLYVSDIDRLAVIDINKGQVIQYFDAPTARFLNDLTLDAKNNAVYVSDMQSQKIYQLQNGKFEEWLESPELTNVNGLFFREGFLYAGASNAILKIDPKTRLINMIVNNTGRIDGLETDSHGNWIFSDWYGNVFRVKTGEIEKILSTSALKINAADIEFIPSKKLLLVPTFFDNRVVAYKLKK